MKLMKIFGMVFALHVALACVLVLIQGCRSTAPRSAESPMAAAAPTPAEPVSENWSSQSSTLSPTPVDPNFTPGAPGSDSLLSSATPAERARTSPTRPDNPGAYISTSTPATLAPPPAGPATYVVRAGDSLWKIAHANNSTTAELQKLNPNLKSDSLRPGMTIKVPGSASFAGAPVGPAASASRAGSLPTSSTYVVKSGDSLSKVAARNGTTVAALRQTNNLRSDVIQVGQTLTIPGAMPAADSGRTMSSPDSSEAPASVSFAGGNDGANAVTVVMQRGDTLGSIAKRYDVTVRDLMTANSITDAKKVRVGQALKIPGFQPVGTGALPHSPMNPRTVRPAANPNPPAPVQLEPVAPPPGPARPSELDLPPTGGEAPPVQPIDEPTPAP